MISSGVTFAAATGPAPNVITSDKAAASSNDRPGRVRLSIGPISFDSAPSHRLLLIAPVSGSEDQVGDLLRVGDQGKVTCLQLHGCCFHAGCQKPFQVGRYRLIE